MHTFTLSIQICFLFFSELVVFEKNVGVCILNPFKSHHMTMCFCSSSAPDMPAFAFYGWNTSSDFQQLAFTLLDCKVGQNIWAVFVYCVPAYSGCRRCFLSTASPELTRMFPRCWALLCIFVSQIIPQGVAPAPCIPCCLVLTDRKLLTCHQDCQTSFFRSLGGADLNDITAVCLEEDKEYCVIVRVHSDCCVTDVSVNRCLLFIFSHLQINSSHLGCSLDFFFLQMWACYYESH